MTIRIFFLIFIFTYNILFSQQRQVKRATIAFLNVENLWDTIPSADYIDGTLPVHSPKFHRSIPVDSIPFLQTTEYYRGEWENDLLIGKKVIKRQLLNEDFTPQSPKRWGKKQYDQKIKNITQVISELGRTYTLDNPVICGLIEVENRQAVEDLIRQPALAKSNYGILHYNSFDSRGIDIALIYQKNRFFPEKTYTKEIKLYNEEGRRQYTRSILVSIGILDGEKFAVFMNHWPSRSGGESASLEKRNAAASTLKTEMDAVRFQFPGIKIVAMGDFNDDPVSPSLTKFLGATGNAEQLSAEKPYFNLMYKLYKSGIASLAYRDAPNLFDQVIVSQNLLSTEKNSRDYRVYKAEIFAPSYLITKEGAFKGYPFRSWEGDRFTGGYSDHFPAVAIFQKDFIPN